MYDQSFNKKTLARVFQKLDFVGIKTSEELEAFRETMLNKAIDQMGRSRTNKHRAVLYYIITRDAKREAALL